MIIDKVREWRELFWRITALSIDVTESNDCSRLLFCVQLIETGREMTFALWLFHSSVLRACILSFLLRLGFCLVMGVNISQQYVQAKCTAFRAFVYFLARVFVSVKIVAKFSGRNRSRFAFSRHVAGVVIVLTHFENAMPHNCVYTAVACMALTLKIPFVHSWKAKT